MSSISQRKIFSGKGSGLFILSSMLLVLLTSCGQGSSQAAPGGTSSPTTLSTPGSTSDATYVFPYHNVEVIVASGVAYAATLDQGIYALNANTGSLLWKTSVAGSAEELPVLMNGVVYISSYIEQNGPAYLTALRASDGTQLWRFRGNSYIYQPVEQDGVLYIAQKNDGITALRAENGQLLWHFAGTTEGTPMLDHNLLYTTVGESNQADGIYALHTANGSVAWRYPTSADSSLTLQDGLLYVCCSAGTLSALHTNNGHQVWKQTIDATFIQAPQFIEGNIYFMATKFSLGTPTANTSVFPQVLALSSLFEGGIQASADLPQKEGKSSIYALQANDGQILWKKALDQGKDNFGGSFQVEAGVIYADTVVTEQDKNTGIISALQRSDGKELWYKTVAGNPSTINLNNGILYSIGTGDSSTLYALREQDGSQIWSYPLEGDAYNQAALSLSTIYVGASSGMLYALQAENGKLLWHYQTKITD